MEWITVDDKFPEYDRYVILYDQAFDQKKFIAKLRKPNDDWKNDHWETEGGTKRVPNSLDLWVYLELPKEDNIHFGPGPD